LILHNSEVSVTGTGVFLPEMGKRLQSTAVALTSAKSDV